MGGISPPVPPAVSSGPTFWASFSATPVIQHSSGVLSVTRQGTGEYTVNLPAPLTLIAIAGYIQDRRTGLFGGWCTFDVELGLSYSGIPVQAWFVSGATHNATLYDPGFGLQVYGWGT